MAAPAARLTLPWSLRRPDAVAVLGLVVLVAAGHALGTTIVYQFDHTPSSGVSFFPADGVTLAALLLTGYRRWPVIAAATFLAEYVSHFVLHEKVVTGLGLAASNTLGPVVGAWLVIRLIGHRPHLDDSHDLAAVIAAGVLAGPLLDAVTGPPFAWLTVQTPPYWETVLRWWTGDALGALIVGTLILAWAQPIRWPHPRGRRLPEAALGAAVLVVLAYAVFFRFTAPLAYLVMIPLGWAALRFGLRGATTAVAALVTIAEWATITGHGQFAARTAADVRTALWQLQLFLAVAALAAVVVASEVVRTRRAEAARRDSELAEHRARADSVTAAAAERARLARELHDSVSQALFAAAMHARSAEKQLDRIGVHAPKISGDLAALRELTATAQAEMRALIFELRPEGLAAEGLVAAVQRQAAALQARTGLTITLTGPPGRLPLDAAAEEHLYRITLEALHNAVKHARAATLTVAITDLGDVVQTAVSDDGTGMDPTQHRPGHLGLGTMRERAAAAGGTLTISSRPGRGTTVRCQVPTAQTPTVLQPAQTPAAS